MPHPFDATTKEMIEVDPLGWVRWLGLSGDSAEVINADISTISGDADKVIKVHDVVPYLVHIEMQSGYNLYSPDHIHRTNSILDYRHKMVVQSAIFLLRPEADGTHMTGTLVRARPNQPPVVTFRYHVFRVWQIPAEQFLKGSVALLPFASIAEATTEELPAIIHEMEDRVRSETSLDEAKSFWTAVYVLMGLKFERPLIEALLKGVIGMEDSITYQFIIEKGMAKGVAKGKAEGKAEGEVNEARKMIVRIGTKRFGNPSTLVTRQLSAIDSVEKLEQLSDRLFEVETWDEFLVS